MRKSVTREARTMSEQSFDGVTAFVTGASQGIGREIATVLAERGANVTLAARSDGIYETAESIGDDERALPVECDVTDEAAVEEAVDGTVEAFGGLDVLINNAGIAGPTAPVEEIDRDDFDRTLSVNVTGAYLTVKHAVSHLRESERGRIVNISSVGGKQPYPNRTPYAASKMAMIGLGRTLAFELGSDGVAVNTICPGPVRGDRIDDVIQKQADAAGVSFEEAKEEQYTGDTALGEMVTATEVAETVAYLVSGAGAHVTAQDINVDSGKTWY